MGHQTKIVVAAILIVLSSILLSNFDVTDSTISIKKSSKLYYTNTSGAPSNVTSRRTTITKQTAGTIALSNICLRYKTILDSNNTAIYIDDEIELLSHQANYTDMNEDGIYITHLKRRNYLIQTTPVKDEMEWIDMIEQAEWISSSSDNNDDGRDSSTLWIYNWKESNNPGHCNNDFAFGFVGSTTNKRGYRCGKRCRQYNNNQRWSTTILYLLCSRWTHATTK